MAGQAALLLLSGCEAIRNSTPALLAEDLFGNGLRVEPAPGGHRPYPNLASVPRRPVPPDAATRAALTAGLAADRAASREPLPPRRAAAAGADTDAPGEPRIPQGPPPAAVLATPRPIAAAAPAGFGPTDGTPAGPAVAPDPGGPPPPPPPELLAPPPPPARDLLAPPRLR